MKRNRLDRLACRLLPDESRVIFRRCGEHGDLSWEDHQELHRQRGEYLFTLDLGAANVSEGTSAA